MTALSRVRVAWSGFRGGPGVSTFYTLDTSTFTGSLASFFAAIAGTLPPDVTLTIEPTGDIIEDTTGDLTGAWSETPEDPIVGSGTDQYAAPSGAIVKWATSTISGGSRINGRTFLVPITVDSYEGDGSLSGAFIETVSVAAVDFAAEQSSSFVIWQRPRAAVLGPTGLVEQAARAGSHGLVTSSSVPDFVAILRSRRD